MKRRLFIANACAAVAAAALADVPGGGPRRPPPTAPIAAPGPHHKPHPNTEPCPRCHGSGRVRRNWLGFTKECPECHGTGRRVVPPPPKPKPVPPPPPKPVHQPKPAHHAKPAGGPQHHHGGTPHRH